MLKIAVFDTETRAAELENILVGLLFDRCEFGLENYTDLREIKKLSFEENFDFDIVFAMADENVFPGFETVKRMRESGCLRPEVVLFSHDTRHALDAYKLRTFDYLVKPISPDMLCDTIDRYFIYHSSDIESTFTYKIGGALQTVKQEDILYFMSEARKCVVTLRHGEDEFYAKLDDVEMQIDEDFFIRAHQSYLVNVRYIKSLTREGILMNNDLYVPISQKRYPDVKSSFMKYLGIE